MVPYYLPIVDDRTNYTYSIDNVVIKGKLYYDASDLFQALLNWLSKRVDLQYTYFETSAFASYHYQFRFELDYKRGFFLGVGFNSAKGVQPYVGLDFNPNKVMDYGDFVEVYNYVISLCRPVIKRFDLAIDIPVLRSNIFMLKDRRKAVSDQEDPFVDIRNSWEDHTQYLGRRSNCGYVKLYNKQRESKLNTPMSRLELTLPPALALEDKYIPNVRYFNDLQMVFNELKLNGTDRVLLMACIDDPQFLSMLNKNGKRKKIMEILDQYTHKVEVNKAIYDQIIMQVWQYCKPLDMSDFFKSPWDIQRIRHELDTWNLDELEV